MISRLPATAALHERAHCVPVSVSKQLVASKLAGTWIKPERNGVGSARAAESECYISALQR